MVLIRSPLRPLRHGARPGRSKLGLHGAEEWLQKDARRHSGTCTYALLHLQHKQRPQLPQRVLTQRWPAMPTAGYRTVAQVDTQLWYVSPWAAWGRGSCGATTDLVSVGRGRAVRTQPSGAPCRRCRTCWPWACTSWMPHPAPRASAVTAMAVCCSSASAPTPRYCPLRTAATHRASAVSPLPLRCMP